MVSTRSGIDTNYSSVPATTMDNQLPDPYTQNFDLTLGEHINIYRAAIKILDDE